MSLGDHFPAGMKSASVDRALKPGSVIKFKAVMDDKETHLKRWIVLHVDETTFTCVINSEIAKLHRGTAIESLHIPMAALDHEFMHHDSTIDCSRIRTYSTADIHKQLLDNPGHVLGEITGKMRDQVVAAIKASPLIAPVTAAKCCRAIEAVNLPEAPSEP